MDEMSHEIDDVRRGLREARHVIDEGRHGTEKMSLEMDVKYHEVCAVRRGRVGSLWPKTAVDAGGAMEFGRIELNLGHRARRKAAL
jgi:hypothetical protein